MSKAKSKPTGFLPCWSSLSGNLICTQCSLVMAWIREPFGPMMERWNLWAITHSMVTWASWRGNRRLAFSSFRQDIITPKLSKVRTQTLTFPSKPTKTQESVFQPEPWISYQVLNDLQHAFLGGLHAVFGSFQGDILTQWASAREAHHHASILLSNVPQDLTTPGHKVAVVLGVNEHVVLHHIILREKTSIHLYISQRSSA